MHSTFEDWMEVTGVSFNPPDSRFYYEPPSQERILLIPGKANNVSVTRPTLGFTTNHQVKREFYLYQGKLTM